MNLTKFYDIKVKIRLSYLGGACGVTRWYGESNERAYERCGIGT